MFGIQDPATEVARPPNSNPTFPWVSLRFTHGYALFSPSSFRNLSGGDSAPRDAFYMESFLGLFTTLRTPKACTGPAFAGRVGEQGKSSLLQGPFTVLLA
jgi:hypothetical protein